MSYHLLAYEEALAAGAALSDLDAVPDSEFTRRNDHFIFTEQYNALAFYYQAASATLARLNVPSINAVARHQIYPFFRSATIPTDWRFQDFRMMPMALPENEELAVEGSNNLGCGTENSTCFIWVAPPQWNMNLPRGIQRLTIRATASAAGTAQAWGSLANLTFSENLRGGWYSLVGAAFFDAGTLALRFVFAKPRIYNGRKFRPGVLSMEALGNTPNIHGLNAFGVIGKFHSFEPPQIEIFANATAASTQELWLDLVWHGDSEPQ
jgi:hypothetical protein